MHVDDWLALCVAGFIYIVSPGPVFLSVIGTVSEHGRKAGMSLACGALLGDTVWLTITLALLIEASRIPALALDVLAGACAFYLFWLAFRMIRAHRLAARMRALARPFVQGAALGLLNPKSYPVLTSVLAGAVIRIKGGLALQDLPTLMLAAGTGFVAGYAAMIGLAGLPGVNSVYKRNARSLSLVFGLVFLGFGINLLRAPLAHLAPWPN